MKKKHRDEEAARRSKADRNEAAAGPTPGQTESDAEVGREMDAEIGEEVAAEIDAEVRAAPTAGEAAELQRQLDELRQEVAEQADRRLRLAAELDNLRKRSRREVEVARRFAQADILRPLLDVLDDFDRALSYSATDQPAATLAGEDAVGSPNGSAFQQGVEMIAQSFRQALYDRGVRPIEAIGRPFDPALHEAVGQMAAPPDVGSGTVVTEILTGYTFDDLVLRASRVIVAQ